MRKTKNITKNKIKNKKDIKKIKTKKYKKSKISRKKRGGSPSNIHMIVERDIYTSPSASRLVTPSASPPALTRRPNIRSKYLKDQTRNFLTSMEQFEKEEREKNKQKQKKEKNIDNRFYQLQPPQGHIGRWPITPVMREAEAAADKIIRRQKKDKSKKTKKN